MLDAEEVNVSNDEITDVIEVKLHKSGVPAVTAPTIR